MNARQRCAYEMLLRRRGMRRSRPPLLPLTPTPRRHTPAYAVMPSRFVMRTLFTRHCRRSPVRAIFVTVVSLQVGYARRTRVPPMAPRYARSVCSAATHVREHTGGLFL